MHIYSTQEEIEPIIEAYIGERKDDKQFFPVFVGFLVCLNAHCIPDSVAELATKKMVVHYQNLILAPAIAPAQRFAQGIDAMVSKSGATK